MVPGVESFPAVLAKLRAIGASIVNGTRAPRVLEARAEPVTASARPLDDGVDDDDGGDGGDDDGNDDGWALGAPLLAAGANGTFDSIAVKDPSIVFAEGRWRPAAGCKPLRRRSAYFVRDLLRTKYTKRRLSAFNVCAQVAPLLHRARRWRALHYRLRLGLKYDSAAGRTAAPAPRGQGPRHRQQHLRLRATDLLPAAAR